MLNKVAFMCNKNAVRTVICVFKMYLKLIFIPVIAKLNLKRHYSNLQCHLIMQKSNMLLKKHYYYIWGKNCPATYFCGTCDTFFNE